MTRKNRIEPEAFVMVWCEEQTIDEIVNRLSKMVKREVSRSSVVRRAAAYRQAGVKLEVKS